jgi:hypothetical protein
MRCQTWQLNDSQEARKARRRVHEPETAEQPWGDDAQIEQLFAVALAQLHRA